MVHVIDDGAPATQVSMAWAYVRPQFRRRPSWFRVHGAVTIPSPASGSVTSSDEKLLASHLSLKLHFGRSTVSPAAVLNAVGSQTRLPVASSTGSPSHRNPSGFERSPSGLVTGAAWVSTVVTSTHWHSMPALYWSPHPSEIPLSLIHI